MSEIPELTEANLESAILAYQQRRLIRGEFESSEQGLSIKRT